MIQNNYISPSLLRLAEQFQTLPGIGRKNAMRLAFAILQKTDEEATDFVTAITDICPICADTERDHSTICVVEDVRAVMAFEKVREFNGVYHVLHGALSPLNGIGPDKLHIDELVRRVSKGGVNEVIVATNSTVEGEATAMYLTKILKPYEIKVTRLACGMPVGGELEFADEVTLFRALEGRRSM